MCGRSKCEEIREEETRGSLWLTLWGGCGGWEGKRKGGSWDFILHLFESSSHWNVIYFCATLTKDSANGHFMCNKSAFSSDGSICLCQLTTNNILLLLLLLLLLPTILIHQRRRRTQSAFAVHLPRALCCCLFLCLCLANWCKFNIGSQQNDCETQFRHSKQPPSVLCPVPVLLTPRILR